MDKAFTLQINQTCRKFIKRCYWLQKPADENLLEVLSEFGLLEIQDFKKFVPTAKNVYKIAFEDYAYISGALEDNLIYFTIPKENQALIALFEEKLCEWFSGN
jgi:hypothetical protein